MEKQDKNREMISKDENEIREGMGRNKGMKKRK